MTREGLCPPHFPPLPHVLTIWNHLVAKRIILRQAPRSLHPAPTLDCASLLAHLPWPACPPTGVHLWEASQAPFSSSGCSCLHMPSAHLLCFYHQTCQPHSQSTPRGPRKCLVHSEPPRPGTVLGMKQGLNNCWLKAQCYLWRRYAITSSSL